ncbi:MAG: cation transporter, partial [Patescibacteria group bacterium]
MHCASCAKLIERKLRSTPGVEAAAVNYGSESATVDYDPSLTSPTSLISPIASLGYKAIIEPMTELSSVKKSPDDLKEEAKRKELADLKIKVIVSAILSFFITLGSFPEWFAGLFSFLPFYDLLTKPLALLALTTPVQLRAGWGFYQDTWSGLRNRAAGMDNLIAIGTTAA